MQNESQVRQTLKAFNLYFSYKLNGLLFKIAKLGFWWNRCKDYTI